MITLGTKVKDPITGFIGTVTGKTEWLYGCARIAVQASMDKDGKVPSLEWFDELQLEAAEPKKDIGGPQSDGGHILQETG